MRIKYLPTVSANRFLALLAISVILASGAWAQTQQVLYSLGVVVDDGAGPAGGLVLDKSGNLYGTTALGRGHGLDPNGSGTVFKLTRKTGGGWAETVLHTFSGKDGAVPTATLMLDSAGNLYGTTNQGGASNAGVVFKLTRGQGGKWAEKVLYSFTGLNDGGFPVAGVISDAAGNLYGTTQLGGVFGKGTVFELTHATSGWAEKVLYSLGQAGKFPLGGLVFDEAGVLYGTAKNGGKTNSGLVFKLVPEQDGTWKEVVLYNFLGSAINNTDGRFPRCTLVFDNRGNLYGTTRGGGLFSGGIVFELTPPAAKRGAWSERVLHYGGDTHGSGHKFLSGVVFDSSGRLYTTSETGGTFNAGVVFRLTPTANGLWKDKPLYTFTGAIDGGSPMAGVVLDKRGNAYGTTYTGGDAGNGTVFEIKP